MTRKPNLVDALRSAGGSARRKKDPSPPEQIQSEPVPVPQEESARPYRQPGRERTRPITAHFPKSVRDQLKILGIQQDKTMQDLIAEALNDLFAKYGKPEIAPVSHKD
jgi:Antitoxin-like ribbon-helix-helix